MSGRRISLLIAATALFGAACGALLAWSAGWWSLRGVLQRPVVQTLREAQAE